jgi:hypothetical protein
MPGAIHLFVTVWDWHTLPHLLQRLDSDLAATDRLQREITIWFRAYMREKEDRIHEIILTTAMHSLSQSPLSGKMPLSTRVVQDGYGCTVELGVDFDGGDLPNMPTALDPPRTHPNCAAACRRHLKCTHWSFTQSRECFLKHTGDGATQLAGSISGRCAGATLDY